MRFGSRSPGFRGTLYHYLLSMIMGEHMIKRQAWHKTRLDKLAKDGRTVFFMAFHIFPFPRRDHAAMQGLPPSTGTTEVLLLRMKSARPGALRALGALGASVLSSKVAAVRVEMSWRCCHMLPCRNFPDMSLYVTICHLQIGVLSWPSHRERCFPWCDTLWMVKSTSGMSLSIYRYYLIVIRLGALLW